MAARSRGQSDPIADRLDMVIELLQDLFILEGVKEGVNKKHLGKVVGVRQARISKISKLMKSAKQS